MNPTPLPPNPGSATIAGWNERFGPAAILAGWFAITRVEVLVERSVASPLSPLARAALRAVSVAEPPTLETVARMLHLGERRTASVIEGLCEGALIDRGSSLVLTEAGRTALKTGERLASTPVRRALAFREGAWIPVPEAWQLKPLGLPKESDPRAAVQWVREAGFDIATRDWLAVPTVCPEWLPLVVVAFDGPSRADVFLAEVPEWTLPSEPCCSLDGERARAAFPELATDAAEGPVRKWSVAGERGA